VSKLRQLTSRLLLVAAPAVLLVLETAGARIRRDHLRRTSPPVARLVTGTCPEGR
jgi:hypothetical protein